MSLASGQSVNSLAVVLRLSTRTDGQMLSRRHGEGTTISEICDILLVVLEEITVSSHDRGRRRGKQRSPTAAGSIYTRWKQLRKQQVYIQCSFDDAISCSSDPGNPPARKRNKIAMAKTNVGVSRDVESDSQFCDNKK